ncbi:MAG: hypothetical protein WC867_05785 [Candidatus Pacearchaeota archaeon]|jgi:hypothetical protein
MTSKNLRNRVYELYGEEKGELLYSVMEKIDRKDFCVATGWKDNELSIALGCGATGQIFKISKDYKSLISPDLTLINVRESSYKDIAVHLFIPKLPYNKRRKHCSIDDRIRLEREK